MTAVVFIAAGVLAALWYYGVGYAVGLGLTVWTAWYLSVLLTTGFFILRSGDASAKRSWVVLVAFWVAAQILWSHHEPHIVRAVLHILLAAWFVAVATRLSDLAISSVFCVAVLVDLLTYLGILPDSGQRPSGFVEFAYPDILAGISHAATILLASPHDGGAVVLPTREPDWLGRRPHLRGVLRGSDMASQRASRTARDISPD